MTRISRLAWCALPLLTGCVSTEETAQVSSQFFEAAPARTARKPAPAAEDSICIRVDAVGRKVLGANPIGLQPIFATFQSPTPEIFHVDQKMVCITDSFVKQLPNESELAAVLSFELARMVAEREARVKSDLRQMEVRTPITLPIGDNGGQASAADMMSTVELAKYEKKRDAARKMNAARINPQTLARDYLQKAGYDRTEFDKVQPLLDAAEKNYALERQMKGMVLPSAWTP